MSFFNKCFYSSRDPSRLPFVEEVEDEDLLGVVEEKVKEEVEDASGEHIGVFDSAPGANEVYSEHDSFDEHSLVDSRDEADKYDSGEEDEE